MIEKRKLLELFKKNPELSKYLQISSAELEQLAFNQEKLNGKVEAFLRLLTSYCNKEKPNKAVQQVNIVIDKNAGDENAN